MTSSVTVSVQDAADAAVLRQLADCLRAGDGFSRQLRDFAASLREEQRVQGITWQPQPGHILICHFGLGFRPPEMVKTRPVMVISPKTKPWTRLTIVVPISSKRPEPQQEHHFKLPDGLLPMAKYPEAWIKADTLMAVSAGRLDRIKTGFRSYVAPLAPPDVLREVRRCILHATGMGSLTPHW